MPRAVIAHTRVRSPAASAGTCRSIDGSPSSRRTTTFPDSGSSIASGVPEGPDATRELADQGETQLALHVIDLLALGAGDDPHLVDVRTLKAELCRNRATQVAPFVSTSCYLSSAHLFDNGHTSWSAFE